jgi:formylglycine-generating enzyme required for sulfatase activity
MNDMKKISLYLITAILILSACSAPGQEAVDIEPTQIPVDPVEAATSLPTPIQSPTPESSSTPLPTETPPEVEPEAGSQRVWEGDEAEMVYVPSGTFLMGSSEDNDQADNVEFPQHEVYLNGFWIDKYEVTNQRYALCVDDGVCDPPSESGSFTRDMYFTHPEYANYPVVWVNWFDANRYCEWAGKQLPTEAQWEKAARGTDAREFPWGDEPIDETRANFGTNVGDTTVVGFYSPQGDSPYGCADMAGNVMEWIKDWFSESYYPFLDQVENPTGPASHPYQYRGARGGSWIYPARRARTALRNERLPELREGNIGFRCIFSY